jgi:hypothetical protein
MTDFNLYEFPEGHTGRRTYVSVRGHRRSVPSVYTYRGTDGRNYVHPDFGGDWAGIANMSAAVEAPMILAKFPEYVSTLDGSYITDRGQHRDHMRAHGVIEVGNEKMGMMVDAKVSTVERKDAIQSIARHIDEVKRMPEAAYQERVARTLDTATKEISDAAAS